MNAHSEIFRELEMHFDEHNVYFQVISAILPAILCNAGGVTVSYLEWKQNRQAETWDLEFIDGQLKKMMQQAAQRVLDAAEHYACSLRQASYCAGLRQIQRVYGIRGIFP